MNKLLLLTIIIGVTWVCAGGAFLSTLNDETLHYYARNCSFYDWVAGFITGGAVMAILAKWRVV